MAFWTKFLFIFLLTSIRVQNGTSEGECSFCVGEQFECINENCYCATGYVPNYHNTDCTICPGLGEKCYGPCCSENSNETLQCWRGICQSCYDLHGNWICRDSLDQIILVSGSQIIMAIALVLGIIATFTLLYKLCAVTNLRPLGNHSSESRLSVGSLQIYVNERLRDAPPRYSRTAPSGSAIYPAAVYLNAGFVHDNSLPPPPYTPEQKNDNETNTTIHM
ncbi:uncharacterized protein LOC125065199 [Vanessa atalanta]|uniref:uncharacterized protein LOC125065199 n=1 Tax=Vanessa atalanta TaxID=42275 RepID=UPI001FCCDF96|nr:uncharacterized protein LOC125065199 [Vanessa atalanta]